MTVKTALIVAAHPDDESIGMGGTWFSLLENGWKLALVWMTDGESSRLGSVSDVRTFGYKDALALLNPAAFYHFSFPDNALDSVPLLSIIKELEKVIEEVRPTVIYTHSPSDLNIDHRIVHEAVLTAARPLPESTVRTILGFEVLSATHWNGNTRFNPSWYVDITDYLTNKEALLDAYEGEMRPEPHARSKACVMNLNRFRGGVMGQYACEAFELYRHLESTT